MDSYVRFENCTFWVHDLVSILNDIKTDIGSADKHRLIVSATRNTLIMVIQINNTSFVPQVLRPQNLPS